MDKKAIVSERVIKPKSGFMPIDFKELWQYRELFVFLTWRDILIRYKQTVIGISWAILQPLFTMIIFTLVFSGIAKLPSNDAPYAVMTFAALLPWQFFANAMSISSNSVVNSGSLITKIYFPRLIIPTSSTLCGAIDFAISFVILLGLMLWYDLPFRPHLLLLPLFSLLTIATALGVGFWLSALNVKYRDVKHIVPFFVRMGLYVSPVGFMSSIVPEKWLLIYNLNPMVGIIDGFRWAILGSQFEPYWPGFWASVFITTILLVSGAFFFNSTEKTFADVI